MNGWTDGWMDGCIDGWFMVEYSKTIHESDDRRVMTMLGVIWDDERQ